MQARSFLGSAASPEAVYTHQSYVLDQNCTGLVRNLPTPGRSYFGLENAAPFREQFRRRGQRMRVLIERRGSDKPWDVPVLDVDGNILVLGVELTDPPKEGACVQLLLGYRTKYIDARGAEKMEKDEAVRWI